MRPAAKSRFSLTRSSLLDAEVSAAACKPLWLNCSAMNVAWRLSEQKQRAWHLVSSGRYSCSFSTISFTRSLLQRRSLSFDSIYLPLFHSSLPEMSTGSVMQRYWKGVSSPSSSAWGSRISALIFPPKSGSRLCPSIRSGVAVRPSNIFGRKWSTITR